MGKATAENYEGRVRRLGFYERKGFYDLHVKMNEAGVVYGLFLLGFREEG